jgi:hypothetical protein
MSTTVISDSNINTTYNQNQINYNTVKYYNVALAAATYTLPTPLPQLVIMQTLYYETQNFVLPAADATKYLGCTIRFIKTLVDYPPIPPFPYTYADHWPATISVAGGGWILPFGAMSPMAQTYNFADNKFYLEMTFDGQYWKVCNLS